MTLETRRKEIFHLLQNNVSLETNKLAAMFGVSPVTIRRDFEYLEKSGLVTTIYGGAMVNHTLPDMGLEEDTGRLIILEKHLIAKAAAELLKPGDTILLDAGSTTKELAIELLTKTNITVLTNSILAINVLAQGNNTISLMILPGSFKKTTMCFLGAITLDFLDFVHVDYSFIGVTALSFEHGGTIPDPEEAYIKRKMAKSANHTVVLADHRKIGHSSMFTALSTEDIDILITGKGSAGQLQPFRDAGIQVIEADGAMTESIS
ncbi:MAG: DeoR/GlpR family DNA-binding transcription regulator [Spirochaetaceae bacterium]|jgi:DeoR/GlpR family transcriptional regulator of sugar metabolism|nr:DeoR/GlpR family DNA-binding transcription regulator [Spirochaetaceae bacterium]